MRRFHALRSLRFILALSCLPAMPVGAGQAPTTLVEFPVWNRTWIGTLGSKQVEVFLKRTADDLSGSYCYQPCTSATRNQLVLEGRVRGDGANLIEQDHGSGAAKTGVWQIDSLGDDVITGTWTSPNGQRAFPLALHPTQVQREHDARFPYQIRMLADALPKAGDGCHTSPLVSAIRLYKDGALFQTLETESVGPCGVFTPKLIDANFDGWLDLTIALFLPAGPNIPRQTWLYDAAAGRFVDAPPLLQDIPSAEFDPVHQVIHAFWRASCCEHGVSIYRWKGSDVELVDSQSSYFLPLLDGTERRLCYIVPSYRDGFIEFASRVEQAADGRLELRQIDPKNCDTDAGTFLERTYIEIWQPGPPGQKPMLLRAEDIAWIPTDTPAGERYCPEVPFFDSGRIRREVLSENLELCREKN